MKNRYFIIGGISSVVIYISLIIAIIIYIQKPSKKYISNPQKNSFFCKLLGQSHAEDCIRPILYFSKFNFTFNTFKIWSKSGTLTTMSANIL